jgi:ABC-type polysaccharide/polyol phosphate transport system ATPase subunit
MSEYCAISTRNFSRKEVDKFGKVTILRKSTGLEIELKLDIDDPVEKKLYLVDEVIEYLTDIRKKLQEEVK